MQIIDPSVDQFEDARIAIICTQWNPEIVDSLVEAAERVLLARGVQEDNIELHRVPGAFEIPLLCEVLAGIGEVDAVIALGAVIKGDTAHFEYVAGECARGLADVSRQHQLPVGFGVLATYDLRQAYERAGPGDDNKGVEAANAVLDMLNVLDAVDHADDE